MDASTVVAICAALIAVASLVVSVYEGRETRRHHRLSVRPVLRLEASFHPGKTSGLRLMNVGLGPAVMTETHLTVDGQPLGPFSESNVNPVRDRLGLVPRPSAVTYASTAHLESDYDRYLLSVEGYDRDVHASFRDLLEQRLRLEIRYESLYGPYESRSREVHYSTVHEPNPTNPQPDREPRPSGLAPTGRLRRATDRVPPTGSSDNSLVSLRRRFGPLGLCKPREPAQRSCRSANANGRPSPIQAVVSSSETATT
jgi:hypothetical protein